MITINTATHREEGDVSAPDETPRRERFVFPVTDTANVVHRVTVERVVLSDYVCQWRAVWRTTGDERARVPSTLDNAYRHDSPRAAAIRGALNTGVEVAAVGDGEAVVCAPMPRPGEVYRLRGTDERWRVVALEYGSVRIACVRSGQRRDVEAAGIAENFERVEATT